MWKYKYLILFFAGLLLNCGDAAKTEDSTGPIVSPSKSYFVSATISNELTAETLKTLAKGLGQNDLLEKIKYDVSTYKLVYKTTYNGQPIEASGLIYIPKGLQGKAPLLSLQHGTTFKKNDAPSVTGEFYGVELFASAGYISFMPDFIGYGASSQVFHPYYDKTHSALAVIDMVKSVKEFLTKEKIEFNDQLFLAGYSEGGYVTLAAAQEIETNKAHNLTVTAVAAGAGGYDLSEMLKGVTTDIEYSYPSYLAFVLMSYNNTYNWNKPLTYFFRDNYATALDTLLTGEYDGGFINSRLTTTIPDLFNTEFYENLKEPQGELQLKEAIVKNGVAGWKTQIPIRLYHGTNDEIIPYRNSEITLENFKSQGSADVTLTLIPGGGHGSSFLPMLKSFVPWFEEFR
ncbi:MAG TPA: alpha/beta fold hydrolase [Cytophagales bacterium]|nr:alpha/beta fold hydrolase [Cytophagales bacterium]